ncbi:hypothetical protein JMUB6875_73400 [Nocardia sp. JMUB6875]
MRVLNPLWFVLTMLVVLTEQPLLPVSVLPTLGAITFVGGMDLRLARSRNQWVARIFGWLSPVESRWGLLLRFVDDEGRKWEARFLPVTPMELLSDDLMFANGWIQRRDQLQIWGLTNIRTGVHKVSRYVAVWPLVVASIVITMLCAIAVI